MQLYTRALPGGGTVVIEDESSGERDGFRARVIVERRADPRRRAGHTPPVVAVASGASRDEVFRVLYPIASDNVEIARALRRLAGRPSGERPQL